MSKDQTSKKLNPRGHASSEQFHDPSKQTTSKNKIKNYSEQYRTNLEKYHSINKSNNMSNSLIENVSINASSNKTTDCDMQEEKTLYIFYPDNLKEGTTKNNLQDAITFKKKKSKKSKIESVDYIEKNTSDFKNVHNKLLKTENLPEISSNSISKDEFKITRLTGLFTEKQRTDEIPKETTNTGKKAKKIKKKSQAFSSAKEEQKLKAKEENAIQSLKSLIEAYINANEVSKL